MINLKSILWLLPLSLLVSPLLYGENLPDKWYKGTISIKNQPKIKSTTFFLNAYNHMKRGGRKYFGRLFWHLHHFITGYKENQ